MGQCDDSRSPGGSGQSTDPKTRRLSSPPALKARATVTNAQIRRAAGKLAWSVPWLASGATDVTTAPIPPMKPTTEPERVCPGASAEPAGNKKSEPGDHVVQELKITFDELPPVGRVFCTPSERSPTLLENTSSPPSKPDPASTRAGRGLPAFSPDLVPRPPAECGS